MYAKTASRTCKKLVHYTIRGTSCISNRSAAGLGNGIKFVKEHHARCGSTGFVEDVANVAFRLAEPHGEQFRTLDRDEIGSTFVGNSLGEQRLTRTRRAIEEDAARR